MAYRYNPLRPGISGVFSVENREKKNKKPAVKLGTKSKYAGYFMPMLESFAAREGLNEVVKNRVVKACDLLDAGVPLFPNDFRKEHSIVWVLDKFGDLEGDALEKQEDVVAIAGRIVSLRSFGKVAFFHIMDQTGRVQCYAAREHLDDATHSLVKKLDIGDIVGVSGHLFRTKTGELTIACRTIKLITRSMRPLPEKYHGLKDMETRYRQRYVDLIVTPRAREIFFKRSQIVREFRHFMEDHGFMEVETPMMQPLAGGAAAKPFKTHHNALDMGLYMRIAPELYLKRLLVGGFEKVFELNRNFRNEGVSPRHNPEFTMMEFYAAYVDYKWLMDFTETVIRQAVVDTYGTPVITYQGKELDFSKPFRRYTILEAISKYAPHYTSEQLNDAGFLRAELKKFGVKLLPTAGVGALQLALFEETAEAKLWEPTYIIDYPVEVSPLARASDTRPGITERFELFMVGREIANGFSELNDPEDQSARFMKQVEAKDAGDEEAMYYDSDYIRALEYGMPPAGGCGIGIDRLVMLLTDSPNIRDVILFPHMRRED